MQAGRMKYKLQILEPVRKTDRFGAEHTDFEPRQIIWAERVKFSGRRSNEVGERFPDYHVEFNIRDAHKICENWRVKQLGGYVYTVTNIEPNRDRGMLTLICERFNP